MSSDRLADYRDYLRVLAERWIGHALQTRVDASDAVQQTLLRAHERIEQFQGENSAELAGWLRTILARQLVDLARKHHVTSSWAGPIEQSLQPFLDQSSEALGKLADQDAASPSQTAAHRESAVLVARALCSLADEDRQVIDLRNFQELTWAEIGGRMHRSEDAARMLWVRALQRLRPAIEVLR